MRGSRKLVVGGLLSLLFLPSCAWSNPDNRPVWNKFEENLVPDDTGWFAATLPVTVPLGLLSIAVDTVIAHPLQVVDDAYDDSSELWDPDDLEFDTAYYTEMGFLPLRTIATPIVFTGSFLARSIFDIRAPVAPMTDEEEEVERRRREEARKEQLRKSFLSWLRRVGRSGGSPNFGEWHPSFDEPMRAALASDAAMRANLHTGMLRAGHVKVGTYDAELGLRDADPVVRYMTVNYWPRRGDRPSAELVKALLSDPVESVRIVAQRKFGQ